MNGEASTQDWDAYPPGGYAPAGHGPPPGYGQQAYGAAPPYGPPPGYGPAAYGLPPGYGPYPGHAYPGHAYPGHAYGAAARWPHGPARPGAATAAAVLGFVTGGLTILVSFVVLLSLTEGDGDPSALLMLLGFPCAVAVIAGAAVLLSRGSPNLLLGGALASVGVLLLVALVGLATLDGDDLLGMAVVVVLALPLPVLTAVFARQPQVRGWAAAG